MRCKCGLKPRFENAASAGFFKHHRRLGQCDCKRWTMSFFQTALTKDEAKDILRKREEMKNSTPEAQETQKILSGRREIGLTRQLRIQGPKEEVHDDVFLIGYKKEKNRDECGDVFSSDSE